MYVCAVQDCAYVRPQSAVGTPTTRPWHLCLWSMTNLPDHLWPSFLPSPIKAVRGRNRFSASGARSRRDRKTTAIALAHAHTRVSITMSPWHTQQKEQEQFLPIHLRKSHSHSCKGQAPMRGSWLLFATIHSWCGCCDCCVLLVFVEAISCRRP